MSWKASGFVKELTHTPSGRKLSPSEKCLLYTLADYYDEERGYAWPSRLRLSKESLVSERNCSRLVTKLEEDGVLLVIRSKDDTNHYHFCGFGGTPTATPSANLSRAQLVTPAPDGTTQVPPRVEPGDTAMAPKPSRAVNEPESSSPTSLGKGKTKKKPDARHEQFKEVIFQCYQFLNKSDPTWDGSDAYQLSQILKASPKLTLDEFRQWLRNYAKSRELNLRMRPREFLPKIHLCATGPVKDFWKPTTTGPPPSADPDISPAEKIKRQLQHRPRGLSETDGN